MSVVSSVLRSCSEHLVGFRVASTGDEASEIDRFSGLTSVLIGLVFGGLAMIYSLVVYPQMHAHQFHGIYAWWVPGDIWNVIDAGRYVWHGALGYAYSQSNSYALPLSFILASPVAAIIDHFRLVEGIVPIPRPSAWLVAGPFSLLFGIFLLDAVRRLAWDLGQRRKLWLVQLLTVVVALVPGFEWGHFEDVLGLAFVVYASRYLLAGRYVGAGLLISLAVCSKQWAVMLIPLVVVLAPAGRRLRTLIAACALPGLFTVLVVAVGGSRAISNLFSPVNLGKSAPGHTSFYLTWLGSKTSQASRSLGTALTLPVSWAFRKVRSPASVLAAMSVLVLIRPFSEAINYSYYWAPALLLAGMVGVAAHHKFRMRDWIWQVPAILWTLPHGNYSETTLWWTVEMAFLVATYYQVALNCGMALPTVRIRRRGSGQVSNSADMESGEPAAAF